MERSDWSIRKLGGWSKPPPQKALEGLYGQTRDAVIGPIKSDVIIAGVYNDNVGWKKNETRWRRHADPVAIEKRGT